MLNFPAAAGPVADSTAQDNAINLTPQYHDRIINLSGLSAKKGAYRRSRHTDG